MTRKLSVVVSGPVASVPRQGGATWAVLQYVLGLQELGHRVYFIELIPDRCIDPPGNGLTHSLNAHYFNQVMGSFGLSETSALIAARSRESVGFDWPKVQEIARSSDLLINLSGYLPLDWFRSVPVRLYLDLDPGFTQLWSEVQEIDMRLEGHTHFATVGMSIGSQDCAVLDGGVGWIKTWQPVVLSRWLASDRLAWDAATTVANWRSYGSVEHKGIFYGQKAHSWRQFMNLPLLSHWRFVAALSIHPRETLDLDQLAENHWELVDPLQVAGTPQLYQEFIQQSRVELAIVKSGYSACRCGWFSERSECYLASAKPVVAQMTGFEQYLPCGKGVFAFSNNEQVLDALARIERDYTIHCRAARHIAEEFFDSRLVLTRLLARVGVAG